MTCINKLKNEIVIMKTDVLVSILIIFISLVAGDDETSNIDTLHKKMIARRREVNKEIHKYNHSLFNFVTGTFLPNEKYCDEFKI